MSHNSRKFIRIALVVMTVTTISLVGATGTALAGDKCGGGGNGGDCPEDPPGNEIADPPGHDKDEGDSGGEAHDRDEDQEKPGERIGHCKFD